LGDDEASLKGIARAFRACATPRMAEAQYRYTMSADVRDVLPLIQAPTLVIHNRANPFIPVEHGEYLADHIAGAKMVTIDSADTSGALVVEPFVAAVSEFLTGQRPDVTADRVLATVMFTDIVESTESATRMGDSRWRRVLDAHDGLIREQLPRFGGREVNTTGDGFVATFDGPARAVRCGQALVHALAQRGIQIRVGVHTGECERRSNDLAGVTVHIAARVGALAGPNQVLVTSTVRDLVLGSGIAFEEVGAHNLKGIPGCWILLSAQP
jgi:class 3 adenylate cyclase